MNVFAHLETAQSPFDSAVALGYFDGLHLAHKKIIETVLKSSKSLIPTVFTFTLDDGETKGDTPFAPLMSEQQRVAEIEKMGVQQLLMPPFSEIKNLTAEEFFEDVLIKKMRAKKLACGFNFRFGKGNTGDVNLLKTLCEENGVELLVTPQITFEGKAISSTLIRECLKNGEVEKAEKMLGESYKISDEIVHGAGLGNLLGFPTLNQDALETPLRYGVYLTKVELENGEFNAITNVGIKPTVNGKTPVAETHLFDFSGDIYGKTATVKFLKFLRDETKFPTTNHLKTAVLNDIKKAKEILSAD